jgi:hypothetical protein
LTEHAQVPDFIDLLDEQARDLLQRVKEEAKLEGEGRLTVQDHVRAFSAVTGYVETRMKLAPPEKARSGFSQVLERLNDAGPRKRNGAAGRAAGGGGPPAVNGAEAPPTLRVPEPPPV